MPSRPAVILTAARNGCHWLQGLLCANGYQPFDEIFRPFFREPEPWPVFRDWPRFRRKEDGCYIVHYIHIERFLAGKTVAEKVQTLNEMFEPCDYIILRRNPLAAALSWQFVLEALKKTRSNPALFGQPSEMIKHVEVTYDYYTILSELKAQYHFQEGWSVDLSQALKAHEITYEQLNSNLEHSIRSLCERLKVEFITLEQDMSMKAYSGNRNELLREFVREFECRNHGLDPAFIKIWQVNHLQ